MKVIVFGGSGFLGSYVVDELIARGHRVTVFDRRRSPFNHPDAEVVLGDVLDSASVAKAVKGHEVVYNFAGLADLNESIHKPIETVRLNVLGNMNVLEACRAQEGTLKVERFVFASSVYVHSAKGAFYGASKKASELIIEQYAQLYGLDYTIVRYGSVYGERADDTNRIHRIIRQALTEGRVTFPGDGSEEREYIHGRDAAKLSVDVLDDQYRNANVILTGIERFRYSDLLGMLKEMMGGKVEIEMLDQDYDGHYVQTPYSFTPSVGVKLVNNPSIDFGQGMLSCIESLHAELSEEGVLAEPPSATAGK